MRLIASVVASMMLVAPGWAQKAPSPPAPPTTTARPPSASAMPPKMAPMQVQVVKSAEPGCEPRCSEWIAAQGDIDQTSVASFRRVLKAVGNRRVPILIDSNGGNVDAAFTIGRMIRAKGLDVAVTKTVIKPCPTDDKPCQKQLERQLQSGAGVAGTPREYLSKCASSCAFILAAGTRRYVGPRTFVGVHQITTFQTQARVLRKYKIWVKRVWGVPVESRRELVSEQKLSETVVQMPTKDSTYTKIRYYFSEMGIDDGIVTLLMATPASTLHVLTRQQLVETRMATDLIDGQQLLTGVPTLRPAAAAALALPSTVVPPPPSAIPALPPPAASSAGDRVSPAAPGVTASQPPAVSGEAAAPAPLPVPVDVATAAAIPTPAPIATAAPKPQRTAVLALPPRPADGGRNGSTKCACPQMTTCTGTWVTMTCASLKALCRSADPQRYARNGCDRLKTLVDF